MDGTAENLYWETMHEALIDWQKRNCRHANRGLRGRNASRHSSTRSQENSISDSRAELREHHRALIVLTGLAAPAKGSVRGAETTAAGLILLDGGYLRPGWHQVALNNAAVGLSSDAVVSDIMWTRRRVRTPDALFIPSVTPSSITLSIWNGNCNFDANMDVTSDRRVKSRLEKSNQRPDTATIRAARKKEKRSRDAAESTSLQHQVRLRVVKPGELRGYRKHCDCRQARFSDGNYFLLLQTITTKFENITITRTAPPEATYVTINSRDVRPDGNIAGEGADRGQGFGKDASVTVSAPQRARQGMNQGVAIVRSCK
ncbi:hypothetical protein Bbelb_175860 [Branchiostoma belcheri]|nr:hypothetical protein Bbelb_175860 [Branchiostoma belcheri]